MKEPLTPARATYHHGDLRQALLEKGIELVAARGPEGFSLREAAREVGVSPAAAYRHFADKPALLAAIAGEGHGLLAVAMERGAARIPDDQPAPARAVARLMAIGQAYVEFAVKNPGFFRVMFGPALKAEGFEPCCSPDSGLTSYEILSATLDGLVQSGAIAAERRAGGEIATWAAVHGLATLAVDGALQLTARQRAEASLMVGRSVLLGLGLADALAPAPPASWKDLHLQHEKRRGHGPLEATRAARRR